jgi:hypothetical protein
MISRLAPTYPAEPKRAALPSIGIFENPAQVCASYDPWNTPCIIGS